MRGVAAKGNRIAELRRSLGLTQEQLARRADCDEKTVRAAEHSRPIDVATLQRLAAALGVTHSEIAVPAEKELLNANKRAVWRYIEAFNARSPDAVANSFLEDGCIMIMAGPELPGGGKWYRGHDGIREWATMSFSSFIAGKITEDMCEIDVVEDTVLLRIAQPVVTSVRTGKQGVVPIMTEFKISNDRIAMMRTFVLSGAMEEIERSSSTAIADL